VRDVKICIFHKLKMAGDRHIENGKFAISPQPLNRSRQNLQIVIVNRSESENLHFSKIQMADGRHIGNKKPVYIRHRLTDRDEILQEYADCYC